MFKIINFIVFSSVQPLSRVWLFATPWTAACQASLSITNCWSLLKFMSIELVMPSDHLILCHPLLLPPSIFPSIRIFSNESVLRIWWSKYRSFSISISPSNEYSELISSQNDWFDLLAVQVLILLNSWTFFLGVVYLIDSGLGKLIFIKMSFSSGSVVKNLPAVQKTQETLGLIPGKSPGGRYGNPLQYCCLGNSMDRGAWWGPHGVMKSWTWLRTEETEHTCMHSY